MWNEKFKKISLWNISRKQKYRTRKRTEKKTNVRIDLFDRATKKNNIIIQGPTIKYVDNKANNERLEQLSARKLKLRVEFKEAGKLGDNAFLAEMKCMSDKIQLLKNKNKVKDIRVMNWFRPDYEGKRNSN